MKIEKCHKADIKVIVDGINTYNLDLFKALVDVSIILNILQK
jgi:hypothetical protein